MPPLLCYYDLVSGQNAHNDKSVYFIRCPRTIIEVFFLQKKDPLSAYYVVSFFMGIAVIMSERFYEFLTVSSGGEDGHILPLSSLSYTGKNPVSEVRSLFFGTQQNRRQFFFCPYRFNLHGQQLVIYQNIDIPGRF